MRKFLVRFLAVTTILALSYSVFWFYLVGQLEKKITNFVSQNSSNIEIGYISVSGFPLSQKITIKNLSFVIPNSAFNDFKVKVPIIRAEGGIDGKKYQISLPNAAKIEYDDSIKGNVVFNKDPEITYEILGDQEVLKYSDAGYVIKNKEDILYESSSSNLVANLKSSKKNLELSLKLDVKDVSGFDIIDIYKNSFEKEIIEGIKTGEISIRPTISKDLVEINSLNIDNPQEYLQKIETVNNDKVTDETLSDNTFADYNGLNPVGPKIPKPTIKTPIEILSDYLELKNNVTIYLEVTFLDKENKDIPDITNPSQAYKIQQKYNKVMNIKQASLVNELYEISAEGKMSYFSEDKMPSGSLNISVSNANEVLKHLSSAFLVIAQDRVLSIQGSSSDILGMYKINDDIYQNFLERLSVKLPEIASELNRKNKSLNQSYNDTDLNSSKKSILATDSEDQMRFNITREKNLEFLINKTPIREVIGRL